MLIVEFSCGRFEIECVGKQARQEEGGSEEEGSDKEIETSFDVER